jgi:hypothetical protein
LLASIQFVLNGTNSRRYYWRGPKALKHEKPESGGKIALFTTNVDRLNLMREGCFFAMRDIFQAKPERLLKANASLSPAMTTERLATSDFIGTPH